MLKAPCVGHSCFIHSHTCPGGPCGCGLCCRDLHQKSPTSTTSAAPDPAEASDPLAATLENVPYVPSLAKTPTTALIDLVAFTNGQTGAKNPQRQGLGSAILDGLSPLNIPADTPASPAYSPLWAINLAKWVGPAGMTGSSAGSVVLIKTATL